MSDITQPAMWDQALDQREITSLNAGFPPVKIRPSALRSYWPLGAGYSPEQDIVNRNNLTLINAPTLTNNPPLRGK